MNSNDDVEGMDSLRRLLEADRSGRTVRVTVRARVGVPGSTIVGLPVRYCLSGNGRSLVFAESGTGHETPLALDEIERVEWV